MLKPSQNRKSERETVVLHYAGLALTVRGLATYEDGGCVFEADVVETESGLENILPLISEGIESELNEMASATLLFDRNEASYDEDFHEERTLFDRAEARAINSGAA